MKNMSLRNNTFPVIQKAALMIVVSFVLMLTGITAKADTSTVTMNAETVTLTDANKEFELEAVSTSPLSSVDWVCSDRSVVTWSSNWNSGQYRWGVKLKALKNGTAVVRLTGSDGTVYASCQVICTDLTETYGIQVAGVEVTNRNCHSVTGEGISGTVIYHPDTNTLTLKNAVLSRGGDGETFCVVLYRGREGQTLSLELLGKNEIRNVSWASYTGGGYVNAVDYDGGEALGSPEGSFFLKGGGSLKVQDSGIGTGVSCRELRIAEGTSLELEIGGGRNSVGIDANSVTIEGSFLTSQTASVDVTGIETSKLIIGKSGDVQISVKNSNGVTSLSLLSTDAIHLPWGGSAEISGKLKASAFDEEDVCSGRGIAGSRSDQPSTVVVKESGQLEISTDLDAFQYIDLILANGLILNAGTDKKSALTKDSVSKENYVLIGKGLPVIPDPETVQKESEKQTDPADTSKNNSTANNSTAHCVKHTFGNWKVTKKATYTAKGEKKRICSTCGYVEKASVAKLKIKAGVVLKDKTGSYKVLKGLKTAAFVSPVKKNVKTLNIPATVKLAGKTFKVTKIQAKACFGYKKLTKVTIGKNVASIGANAFNGCTKLKTIVIKSTKLTTKTVGTNAFKGIYGKAAVKVPKAKLKAYQAFLKKKGVGRNAKIVK